MSDDCVAQSTVSNITGDVTARPSGLTIAGLFTPITLNAVTWTALPATPLADRNSLSIQNPLASNILVKLNFDNTVVGFVGWEVPPQGGGMNFDITPDILVYGKCESATLAIGVMELA